MALHLRQGEVRVAQVNFHWTNYLFTGVWAVAGLLVLMSSRTSVVSLFPTVFVLCFSPLVWKIISNRCKTYAVTNQRIYIEEGVLDKTKSEIPVHLISDIEMGQTLGQKMFGAGNLKILAENKTPMELKSIENPYQFKEAVFSVVSHRES